MLVAVVQLLSCLRLFCNPMDCSLPGSSVPGISQVRILEWAAISFSRGSSFVPREGTFVSCLAGGFFVTEPPGNTCHTHVYCTYIHAYTHICKTYVYVCVCMLSHFSCVQLFVTYALWLAILLCPWNSPGKNTGVDCHALLQGIFPTQGLNLHLLNCRWSFYCWDTGEAPNWSILILKS